jgi:ribonuclease P protein component
MRFRPEQHLRRQSDIRGVREHGRRVDCRAFTIWWRRRDETRENPSPATPEVSSRPARVCVIASTAAVGPATWRNRAKRRLREIFRRHQHLVPRDCDLLLVARAAVVKSPYAELEKKFADACDQIAPDSSAKK